MKVCIIGDGLVSLTLANVLIQKEISVDILSNLEKKKYDKTRTLGLSKSNVDYFNEKITNIKKISWEINSIKVFTEKFPDYEILKFENSNKEIFSIIQNYKLEKLLIKNLRDNKLINFKKVNINQEFDYSKYKLVINCNPKHQLTSKFFSKKIEKSYNSYAYTTIINHKKIVNKTAFQIFTNNGPIAFLPISRTQTSVVYSIRIKKKNYIYDVKRLIKKYNPKYSITKINNCNSFELKASNLRKYYKNNILAFGDLLHKIHPLAGQGFNMSLRDIKLLSELIDQKINLGLEIDYKLCNEFQKRREAIAKIYNNNLNKEEIKLPPEINKPGYVHAWHLYIIQFKKGYSARSKIIKIFEDLDVGFSIHYTPLHKLTYWHKISDKKNEPFTHVDKYFDSCLSLPIFPLLSETDALKISNLINKTLKTE